MKEKIKRTAAQTAVLMAILTLISKLIGFVREMVLASFFGASYVVDAYVMAFTILSALFGGVIAAISTAYMPLFSKISEEKGDELGNRFTSQIINILIVITLIISLVGIIFSNQIIEIFANGFRGETAKLASFFVKVFFSYIIFSSIASILEAYLQYKNIFLPQIVCGYFISACIIVGIIISSYTSYYYLAYGTLIGYALRCITVGYISKKRGYLHYRSLRIGENSKALARLALPVFVGSYMNYLNLFIDKTLASRLIEGSIAALNYAALLNGMIIGITVTILATIIYPKLTHAISSKQYSRFNELVERGFNILIIIVIPCSLGAMIYSNQVVQIVYERGKFDEIATIMTGSAFMYYAAGMLFVAVNDFIIRIYYSMHDMKSPMIFGAISVIINISLNLILINSMAHNGLALATSVAALCNTAMLTLGIRKKYKQIKLVESKIKFVKVIICAIAAVGMSYLVYILIITMLSKMLFIRIIQLGIAVAVAVIIYLVLLIALKVNEVKVILGIFSKNKIFKE